MMQERTCTTCCMPASLRGALRSKLKPFAKSLTSSVYDAVLAGEWNEAMLGTLEWLAPLAHNMIRWQSLEECQIYVHLCYLELLVALSSDISLHFLWERWYSRMTILSQHLIAEVTLLKEKSRGCVQVADTLLLSREVQIYSSLCVSQIKNCHLLP
ncbi:uncharacterized protein [Nicotiana sylvestris]|uniref:uncharacterized protein n=1 Tax=Nicotiana sylvestris TaxID=4096 RepID=UPI00388CC84F